MNNKKLFFSVASVLIVMCAILSGCTEKNERELEQKAIEKEQWDIGKNVDEGLPQDRLNEKIKLTVGGIGLNESSIMGSINEFNATNEKYQIVTEDYADAAASLDQARTVMQTKAMAGDGPDIISFEGISPLKWIGAGMLYNMDGLVAGDPDINENDILIWNALHEYNGLYLMSPTFWTETLACSSETMQKYEGWTINDYLEIEKSLDSNQSMIYYMNPENFIVSIGGRYLQKALDLVNASCDFDNEEFISILESAVQAHNRSRPNARPLPRQILACWTGQSYRPVPPSSLSEQYGQCHTHSLSCRKRTHNSPSRKSPLAAPPCF